MEANIQGMKKLQNYLQRASQAVNGVPIGEVLSFKYPGTRFNSGALVKTRNTFCGTWYLPHSQVHNDRAVLIMVG